MVTCFSHSIQNAEFIEIRLFSHWPRNAHKKLSSRQSPLNLFAPCVFREEIVPS